MHAIILGDQYLRIRDTPGLSGKVLGRINTGTSIEVLDIVNTDWARVELKAAGVTIKEEISGDNSYGYLFAPLMRFDSLPTVPTQKKIIYGYNGIDQTAQMEVAAKAGVKFFVVANDTDFANKLADTYGCMVIFRSLWLNGLSSPQQAFSELSEPRLSKNIYGVVGDNEFEKIRGIQSHASFDTELAHLIRGQNPNKHYLAGTWPVGTPNITNDQKDRDLMRQFYAPGYNAKLFDLDMHLYTPKPALISTRMADAHYYELRWRVLFTDCGFNPSVKGMYSTEWGMDVGGSGGFKAFNWTPEMVKDYYTEHAQIFGEPFMVNGVLVESPFVAGATFALGQHPMWKSYSMDDYDSLLRLKGLITLR